MVMGKEYKQLKVEEREKIAFYYAQPLVSGYKLNNVNWL